ncbi:hypothetical protein BS50DRAFT_630880 [Corynespora cassiicola Philippines]|uniref:Uncharacterized protein n=1 Tax=Corynespora cassiicola Philippines TaxID=1448308 RepID=A0A2T2NZI5_CORCC|nr:hypothetical protein BS50DRAFT_630880 [Corynespora cassiicola Philippines]
MPVSWQCDFTPVPKSLIISQVFLSRFIKKTLKKHGIEYEWAMLRDRPPPYVGAGCYGIQIGADVTVPGAYEKWVALITIIRDELIRRKKDLWIEIVDREMSYHGDLYQTPLDRDYTDEEIKAMHSVLDAIHEYNWVDMNLCHTTLREEYTTDEITLVITCSDIDNPLRWYKTLPALRSQFQHLFKIDLKYGWKRDEYSDFIDHLRHMAITIVQRDRKNESLEAHGENLYLKVLKAANIKALIYRIEKGDPMEIERLSNMAREWQARQKLNQPKVNN